MKIANIDIAGLTSDSRLVKAGFLFAALDFGPPAVVQ